MTRVLCATLFVVAALWAINVCVRWLVILAVTLFVLAGCGYVTMDHTLELRPADGPVLRVWDGTL